MPKCVCAALLYLIKNEILFAAVCMRWCLGRSNNTSHIWPYFCKIKLWHGNNQLFSIIWWRNHQTVSSNMQFPGKNIWVSTENYIICVWPASYDRQLIIITMNAIIFLMVSMSRFVYVCLETSIWPLIGLKWDIFADNVLRHLTQ